LQTLALIDYDMATELIGVMAFGGDRDAVRSQGAFTRECVGAEFLKHLPVISSWDASDECAAVRAPTLVLYHRELGFIDEDLVRDLAARLPDARLSILGGKLADDPVGLALRVAEFIHDGEIARNTEAAAPASGTAIILFADIADSTALTERLGDAAFRERARTLDGALRTIVREHGGTPIEGKLLGDGVLATFPAASQAIAASLAYESAAASVDLDLHVGLHAGDVLREANNVYGGAVNIAARISAMAAPGEVLVSRTVADLARTSAGVTFEDRGEHALKGIAEPQRVFAVRAEAG
jgi:class 3 adenylate cyclase